MKCAIWIENNWAFGRIANAFHKYAQVDIYDWRDGNATEQLWGSGERWKEYDKIITTSIIFMFSDTKPKELIDKLVVTIHYGELEHPYFYETLKVYDSIVYGGVTQDMCETMKVKGCHHVIWTPFGADTDIFPDKYKAGRPIHRIGLVGSCEDPEHPYSIGKGYKMFEDICRLGGFEPVYIRGLVPENMFEDIDLLLCCSRCEGGPLGIFEAAVSGVPVMTTRVGNAQKIKGIRMFDTAEEAVECINTLNASPDLLYGYTRRITNEVRDNWNMEKCITRFMNNCTKVAVWIENSWAYGRIAHALHKYADVDIYNWHDAEANEQLWGSEQKWKQYDTIITTTYFVDWPIEKPPEMLRKMIITVHCEQPYHEYFYETFRILEGVRYAGVSERTCQVICEHGYNDTPLWCPFGVDTDVFPVRFELPSRHIKRIGLVGAQKDPEHPYSKVKGYKMFEDICRIGGFKAVYIFGRTPENMFEDIDLYICCSQFETGPLGIFEAASSGVPVMTTRVGNAQKIKGIRMFDTAEEAVEYIDYWNVHPDELLDYTRRITNEVRDNWNMEICVRRLVPR
jgi:glycosyltransferase involved in cell wall biosynthesis